MDVPRFRIASAMLVVGLVAIDFWAIRELVKFDSMRVGLLVLGALPMANVLTGILQRGQQDLGTRPFLQGFVAFGVIGLVLYVAAVSLVPREVTMLSVRTMTGLLMRTPATRSGSVFIALQCACSLVMLVLPQLTLALVGGILARRHRIHLVNRLDRTPG